MRRNEVLVVLSLVATAVAIWYFVQRAVELARNVGGGVHENDESPPPPPSDPFEGRRLRAFRREGISVPERSADSRECDDFGSPVTCAIDEGYAACFACVESRSSLRVCVHLAESISVHDERTGLTRVVPANSSRHEGYCMREQAARDIRDSNESANAMSRARRECRAVNADWLLVRRRTLGDSTFNFVCRCKYPHLMTNVSGPLSACAKDIACNGHGKLDEDAHESRTDPFVNGRCLCEDGWLAEYDASGGTGPYCREATFAEWPSAFFGEKRSEDDLPLDHDAVDVAFRESIQFSRKDDRDEPVWLPNPCTGCELVRSPETGAYFCGDSVELSYVDGVWSLSHVGVGVRRERDYLRDNGGRLPNACLVLDIESIDRERALLQYMSQAWNDGSAFAQEMGFLVRGLVAKSTIRRHLRSEYTRFSDKLLEPRNRGALLGRDVIWTYNGEEMRQHRERVNAKLYRWLLESSMWATDLCYYGLRSSPIESDDESNHESKTVTTTAAAPIAWSNFSFYMQTIPYHSYYIMDPRDVYDRQVARQPTYQCPDRRGLDTVMAHTTDREVDSSTAERVARSMLPTCLVPWTREDGECLLRPELNVSHDNPAACVILDAAARTTQYSHALWLPGDMNALRFADTRNICTETRRC